MIQLDIAQLRAELEQDLAWRQEEILQLQNYANRQETIGKQELMRRPVILLLYAHFEGYCRFALSLYVSTINRLKLPCHEVKFPLVAATLDDVFKTFRNPEKKAQEFKNVLPDDTQLHRFAREIEFLERTSLFEERIVEIRDDFIDMESNLSPIILRKNLFKLGFKYDIFVEHEGKIHELLNNRNKIAHGEHSTGISKVQYEELRNSIFRIMEQLTILVTQAISEESFRRLPLS